SPVEWGTALLTRRSSYSFEAFGLAGRPPDGRGREWTGNLGTAGAGRGTERLLDLGQAALEGDARDDRAGVAFVLAAVLVLDVLVVADDIHHSVGASGLGRLFHAAQRGLQGPAAGCFVRLVEGIGLLAGRHVATDDLRTRRALGEVELHAAIQPTRSGGFGDHCIEGQVMGGVTRLTDTGQGAKHERRTDPCGFFHCSSPCGVLSKTFSRAAESVGEAAELR